MSLYKEIAVINSEYCLRVVFFSEYKKKNKTGKIFFLPKHQLNYMMSQLLAKGHI